MDSWIENEFKDSKFADLRIRDRFLQFISNLAYLFAKESITESSQRESVRVLWCKPTIH